MEYVKTNDTVHFSVNFYNPTGGYSENSTDTPDWQVYKNNLTNPVLQGPMVQRNAVGSYVGSVVVNAGNGFTPGDFFDITARGTINGQPTYKSMKQFVLDDVVDSNIVQVSGQAVSLTNLVDANITQVDGVDVTLADFNGGGAGEVNANVIKVDGIDVVLADFNSGGGASPPEIADAVWTELISNH